MTTYTIPSVVADHPRGERVMDVYSHLLAERIIYLGTPIDDGVANAIIAQILHLESTARERPISLYINSPGGSVTASLGIYDTMQYVSSPVETACVGQACSTAAVLLAGGQEGRRACLPRSRVLLHQPSTEGRGAVPDLILAADEVVRLRGELEEVLALHTGRTTAELRHDTDRDRIFTPQQAVDYGLVDSVLKHRP